MCVPNFSSIAGLEVAEKFVVVGWWGGWWVEHVTTMSNSNASCFRVGLSWVELRWVLTILTINFFFNLKHFLTLNFFKTKIFDPKIFFPKFLVPNNFYDPKNTLTRKFLTQKITSTQIYFGSPPKKRKYFFYPIFFYLKGIFLTQELFGTQFFLPPFTFFYWQFFFLLP